MLINLFIITGIRNYGNSQYRKEKNGYHTDYFFQALFLFSKIKINKKLKIKIMLNKTILETSTRGNTFTSFTCNVERKSGLDLTVKCANHSLFAETKS